MKLVRLSGLFKCCGVWAVPLRTIHCSFLTVR